MHEQRDAGHGLRLSLLALLFAGPPAILAILFFGERGNDLVGVLSLLLAFVFGLAPFLPKGNRVAARPPLKRAQKVWFALGVLALSAAAAFCEAVFPPPAACGATPVQPLASWMQFEVTSNIGVPVPVPSVIVE